MAFAITDLRKGTVFELDGVPYKVVEYNQKVVGRGGSIVNVRIKNLIDGKLLDKTLKANDQIENADISVKEVQYLYSDNENFYFMDTVNFDVRAMKKSCVHIVQEDGRIIPFESFNLLYRDARRDVLAKRRAEVDVMFGRTEVPKKSKKIIEIHDVTK